MPSKKLKGALGCAGKKNKMKKLMIAAAVAACATVGLADTGIVSANVVGYLQTANRVGLDAYTPAFDGVNATGEMSIQDIVPQNADLCSGVFTITVITDAGDPEMQYAYYLGGETPDEDPKAGWYDEGGVRADRTFKPGEGFLCDAALEDSSLQTAGQVSDADTIYQLRTGLNSVGNASAKTITMADVKVGVAVDDKGNFISPNPTTEEEMASGMFTITRITDAGDPEMQYTYYLGGETPDENPNAGWYDEGSTRVDDFEFDAGKGFYIDSAYTESYIKIPSSL